MGEILLPLKAAERLIRTSPDNNYKRRSFLQVHQAIFMDHLFTKIVTEVKRVYFQEICL